MYMKLGSTETSRFQEILERKEVELVYLLKSRDGLAIEKSADPMDEIQYATERDLAIRNVDRDSTLLRQVRAARQRVQDGNFGACIECDELIGARRLAAVPWAQRCIQCQDAADLDSQERSDSLNDRFLNLA